MSEVPWPADMECTIEPFINGRSWIYFVDPIGYRSTLPVTTGPSDEFNGIEYWHVEVGDGWLETSPSIYFPDHYHSPVSVRWRIVEKLADE